MKITMASNDMGPLRMQYQMVAPQGAKTGVN